MLRSLLVPAGQSWAIIAYNPASALHNFKKSLMSTNRPLPPTVDMHPTEIAVFAVAAEHGNIGTAGVSQVSSEESLNKCRHLNSASHSHPRLLMRWA